MKESQIRWNEYYTPMKHPESSSLNNYIAEDIHAVQTATERIQKILDAKYEKAYLVEIAAKAGHLSKQEQDKLFTLLKKFEPMFDGQLGQWTGKAYDKELREGVTPYQTRPFAVPKCYEETLKKEVRRLCQIDVLIFVK